MRRFGHGPVVPSGTLEAPGAVVPEAFARIAAAPSFRSIFDPLQDDPADLLPEDRSTVKAPTEPGSKFI